MSEKELIDLCQSGKLDYFSELYETYAEAIYKFVYLKTYDKEESEDITSKTFMKAFEKIHTFKNIDGSNFKAWLYRIAYNLVIDTYKSKKEQISMEDILEIGYQNDFAKNLDNKDQIKEVFAYFDTLNPRHKEIIVMRLWDDLSYKEISEIT
jgi:RNA polymerase sigma-70 factor (ECF subfamily)